MNEYHISYKNSLGLICAFRMTGTAKAVVKAFTKQCNAAAVIDIKKFDI